MTSDVQGYLDGLPRERREVVETVRDLVNRHLPEGYRGDRGLGNDHVVGTARAVPGHLQRAAQYEAIRARA